MINREGIVEIYKENKIKELNGEKDKKIILLNIRSLLYIAA